MEGDYGVGALANSWSREAPAEITMQLAGPGLEVFWNIHKPRVVWMCLSQQGGTWVMASLFPSLQLLISLHPSHLP